ncbi:hypothetical protein DL98DRAFT_521360 [Cadophora sp. DSE1049]|nr:hypothetical protein DL98DRAFT_521360 [Cadophora sp. DSE1049]
MLGELHQTSTPFTDDTKLAMQEACKDGDLPTLQRLMDENGGHLKGSGTAPALLKTAVECQYPQIVNYLLSTCPDLPLSQRTDIVASLLKTSNVPILNLLLSHQPTFASISIDYGVRTFLTDACFQPSAKIDPLIHVLLDAGADVNDGMGPGGGALVAALLGGQGKDVVVKILKRGGSVGQYVLNVAVKKERVDVLMMLLKRGGERVDIEKVLQKAREGGNEKVIEISEGFLREKEERIDEDEFGKVGEQRSWWKFWGA